MDALAERFAEDGFVHPIRVYAEPEMEALRRRFVAELLPLWRDPTRENDYTFQTHLLFPWLDAVVRHPPVLEAVSRLLGPDLLLWNSGFVVKPAGDGYFASWHQDLTYWGLEPAHVVTAWLAFTPSTTANGCVRFVPGSHRLGLLPVVETRAKDNMLSRGQVVRLADPDARAVAVELRPGEISIHHGLTVHASDPNRTDADRIGMTMTYIRPEVTSRKGRDTASLVRGKDRFGHFDLAPPPAADLDAAAIAAHRAAARARMAVIHAPG
jgi:ectoine hydroxylase-related dioxygenase (phytanoyl-CoA dioxygenase family)